jgi:hypothetical protein
MMANDLPRMPPLTAEEKAKFAAEALVAPPRQTGPNTAQTPILVPVR